MDKFIPIIIDIILIGYVIYSGFRGFKKGVLGTIIEIASILIILPISILLSQPLSEVAYKNFDSPKQLEQSIKETLLKEEQEENSEKDNNSIFSLKIFKKQIDKAGENTAKAITMISVRAVITLALYLLLKFILFIIDKFIGGILDAIPIIDGINGIGGAALSVLKSAIVIFVILYLIRITATVIPNNKAKEYIQSTVVTRELYNNNIIDNIMG